MDENDESTYKVYTLNPYYNSDKELFGLTIRGKANEYKLAQAQFRKCMVKGKGFDLLGNKMNIVDVRHKKAMLCCIVEIKSDQSDSPGNVEVKVYDQSKNGASIELRKLPDFEYKYVEILTGMIEKFLDEFMAGNNIFQSQLSSKQHCSPSGSISSKPKRFTCHICKWESKLSNGLKIHMSRIHPNHKQAAISTHINSLEKPSTSATKTEHTNKRSLPSLKCNSCESNFNTENKLKEHIHNQHETNETKNMSLNSSSSSPPRKKLPEVVDSVSDCKSCYSFHSSLVTRINNLEQMVNELKSLSEQGSKASPEDIIVATTMSLIMITKS